MKQIFVTHTEQTKKKPLYQENYQLKEKKDQVSNPNLFPNSQPDVLNNLTLASSASSSTTHSSNMESRKISCNFFTNEMPQICFNPNINFNTINTNNNNNNDKNKFLGKKTKSKVRFDIIKNEEKKPLFFNNNPITKINTNQKNDNNKFCVNKFNITNQSILNSPNSNSTEGTLANNKDIEKSDTSETIDFNINKNEKNDNTVYNSFNIFNTKSCKETNIITTVNIKNKNNDKNNEKNDKYDKSGVNEGRWSYEEHIKFIEGITQYGKNWKNVQKYVGTRTSAQARSHAQKFFLKLKAMKNNKFNLDFSDDNIKSLSDIIDIIQKINGEQQFIINTLISLSDSISINETNSDNDLCRSKSCDKELKEKEKEKEKNKNEILLNNNKDNNKKENINNINNIKKDEKKKLNNNILENKDKIKETKINDNFYFNININNNFNDVKFQVPKEEFSFINRPRQQRYIFDDGIIFLSDGSEFFCMDNITLRIKNDLFEKNMKSPYLKFISTFFS